MSSSIDSYQTFYQLGNGKIATIPYVGIVLLILTLVLVYITNSTKFGKKVYAVGSNQKGAVLTGINVSKVKIAVFVIEAVVLGGISMSGGKGKCLGTLFEAMSYTIIDKIIVALKMDSLINNAIKGIILILVIFIQVAGPKIKEKMKR